MYCNRYCVQHEANVLYMEGAVINNVYNILKTSAEDCKRKVRTAFAHLTLQSIKITP